MDDQLDNDLKKRIREVFENFEDHSADEGWLELRKKFPEEKRDRRAFAWIWWGATAALLLLFLGIGLWKYNNRVQSGNFANNPIKHSKSVKTNRYKDNQTGIDSATERRNNLAATNTGTEKLNQVTGDLATKKSTEKSSSHLAGINPTKINGNAEKLNRAKQNELVTTNNAAKKQNASKLLTGILTQVSVDTPAQKQNLAKITDDNKADNKLLPLQLNTVLKPTVEPAKPVTIAPKPPAKSINSMFADDKTTETKKIDDNEKRVRFGVYAATYFNYAQGSNNEINIGAGVTSDIKISKNLKIVTGIAIAQNSLSYTGGSSIVIAQADSRTFPGVSGSAQSNYFGTAASSSNVGLVATVKDYNASMVNLDIPLNLKYEFNPKKGDTYIIAGVSSGTFINETYTSQYASQTYFSPSIQQTVGQTNTQTFSSFYFAKMLNVAFGVGLPFGKNRLTLEPFLKYPLAGLGSQDIRFGAGGINLKFNFQPSKK